LFGVVSGVTTIHDHHLKNSILNKDLYSCIKQWSKLKLIWAMSM
jgi:hypothetical protein